jgi:hypothetical protein
LVDVDAGAEDESSGVDGGGGSSELIGVFIAQRPLRPTHIVEALDVTGRKQNQLKEEERKRRKGKEREEGDRERSIEQD